MKPFEFNGDWEFEYQFDAFKGLQSRMGSYNSIDSNEDSDGKVNVTIVDELDEETDPKQEQINAINYLIKNPSKIRKALYKGLKIEMPRTKNLYKNNGRTDEEIREWFPRIKKEKDYDDVFGVRSVFINLSHKNGVAYIGLSCGCTWDEEHGLGFLLHKDRVVTVGSADAISSWDDLKDNGTYEQVMLKLKEANETKGNLPKPKIYKPHPKYGKLKPSQISANKMYENHLIERKYNKEFIKLVESGGIDINVNKGLSMTFLERAAQMNNLEIVKFILSKNPKSKKYVIHNATGNCNKEMVEILLNNGVDINEPDHWGRTALTLTNQRISSGAERIGNEWFEKYKDFADWLISIGAK